MMSELLMHDAENVVTDDLILNRNNKKDISVNLFFANHFMEIGMNGN